MVCLRSRLCAHRLFGRVSGWFVFEAPWLSPPAPTLVNSVEGAEELLEDLVGVSGYSVHSSRFSVSAAVLAAIFVGVCGSALANFLLQGMVRLWRCPLRFQLFPVSAMSAPSVQGCCESKKILGKGSRVLHEVWVWLALSQVVHAAWAAAAFAFGYLVFVIVSSAAAASAGACFTFLFLEGVYGAAAALMYVATLGGQAHSCCCVQLLQLQVRLGPWSLVHCPMLLQTVASRRCRSLWR